MPRVSETLCVFVRLKNDMRLMVMNGLLGPAKSGEFTPLDINLDDRGRRNGCSLHERVDTSHRSLKTQ